MENLEIVKNNPADTLWELSEEVTLDKQFCK